MLLSIYIERLKLEKCGFFYFIYKQKEKII